MTDAGQVSGPASTAPTLLEMLGARTAAISFDQLDEHGVDLVRTAVVDTLGVALAGSSFDGAAIVRAASVSDGATGPSLVLGTSLRLAALDAGLLNGMAAHALDYDDGNIVMMGHPSTLLVPAVLALGEELDASLEAAAVAYAAGYEVIIRVSRGVNTAHYEKGWHPTSTIGVLGVAAAGARLLGLDAARTTGALAIACSMAAGIKANFGTMTKALHVGQGVRNGLLAAKLAAGGFTANPAAMEAAQGFLDVYNGQESVDADAIVARPDGPLEVNRGFNPIKVYPCCASTHSGVRAAQELRDAHHLDAANAADVRVIVDAKRMPHTDRPVLREAQSGKFSAQYVVARALIEGQVTLADFEGDAHLDSDTVELMRRVYVVAAPPGGPDNSFATEVTVTTTSGQRFRTVVDPGADPSLMAGDSQLWDKFEDCARRALPPEQVTVLVAALEVFPGTSDVRSLLGAAEVGVMPSHEEPARVH
jgi:2-methylcitrate dehydratase PrpD